MYHHRWDLAAAAVVLLIYAVVLSVMPRHVFWSPDEGGKFLLAQSMRWQDGLVYQVPYAGRLLDPEFEFFLSSRTYYRPAVTPSGALRHSFPIPIWFPLISRPGLAVFGVTGLYLLPLLSGWLIAVVSGLLARTFNPRLGPLAILIVGLATPIFFYSLTFWEHTLATLCAVAAVWILVTAQPGRLRTLLSMTPPLLLAMTLRIEMVPFSAACVLTWGLCGLIARWRPVRCSQPKAPPVLPVSRLSGLVAGALLAVGLSYFLVSSITTRHAHLITSLPKRIVASLDALPIVPSGLSAVLINSDAAGGPRLDYAWAMMVALGLCFLAPFLTRVRIEVAMLVPALLVVLGLSGFVVLSGDSYRSLHGIFLIAPFMVVWPYVIPYAWHVRNYALLTLAALAFLYLTIGSGAILYAYGTQIGGLRVGLEWGQRYMLTLYPILGVLSLMSVQIYRESARPGWLRAAFTIVVSILMMVGFQFEVRGLATMRSDRQKLAVWDRALRTEGPIVTDVWWLPSAVAPLFEKHQMFYVADRRDVARWISMAGRHHVPSFTFASMWPLKEGEFGTAVVQGAPEHTRSVRGLYLTRFDIPPNAHPTPATRQHTQPRKPKDSEDR